MDQGFNYAFIRGIFNDERWVGEAQRFDFLTDSRADYQHLHIKQKFEFFIPDFTSQIIQCLDAGHEPDIRFLDTIFPPARLRGRCPVFAVRSIRNKQLQRHASPAS